jgi:DNA-nicking Smr family endonuclease
MVWNEDLAKLKQQMKAQEPSETPPPPPPKPQPAAQPPKSMAEEDAAFLSAMGVRRAEAPRPGPVPAPAAAAAPAPAPPPVEDFRTAMVELGGVKTLGSGPLPAAATPAPAPSPAAPPSQGMLSRPPHLPPDYEPDAETMDIPPPPPQGIRPRPGPLLIQLAAGMAIEVDAAIDLRSHSINDAKERLKERIADGLAMGWRTLHVTLGPGEALRQGFLAFLASPSAASVQRYAQAPVPMGGPQAWILYLGVPGS